MCVHRSVCKCIVWMLASQLCFSTHLHTTQRSGGRGRRRGWELKPESGPGPTVGSAPRSLPPAFMWSLLQKPSSRGNVSLLVCQETSMPKEGASCPDTALPVGYVRTFLPPLPPPVAPSVSFSFVCTLTRCRSAIILVQWPLPRCVCAHSTHLKLHFLNYFFYDCNIKHSHGVYVFSCTTFPFSFRDTVKTASQAPAELMEQLCFVFWGFFCASIVYMPVKCLYHNNDFPDISLKVRPPVDYIYRSFEQFFLALSGIPHHLCSLWVSRLSDCK